MKLINRYKKLSLWNKIYVWGSIASIISVLFILLSKIPSLKERQVFSNSAESENVLDPKNLAEKSIAYSSNNCPSPNEIYRKIKKGPDINRKAIADSYIGQKVEWICKIESIVPRSNDIVTIYCSYKNIYPLIDFDIKSSDYPKLVRINSNKKNFIRLKGTIREYCLISNGISLNVQYLEIYESRN